jgi:hypothetical protein
MLDKFGLFASFLGMKPQGISHASILLIKEGLWFKSCHAVNFSTLGPIHSTRTKHWKIIRKKYREGEMKSKEKEMERATRFDSSTLKWCHVSIKALYSVPFGLNLEGWPKYFKIIIFCIVN